MIVGTGFSLREAKSLSYKYNVKILFFEKKYCKTETLVVYYLCK